MKFRFTIPVLVATLAFFGPAAFQIKADAQTSSSTVKKVSSQPTSFQCISKGKAFATVARKGTLVSTPMIIWESYVFGPEYTPQQRCKTVSQRLTSAVAKNGGLLKNLLLTTGRVQGQTVVCYVNTGAARCDSSNTLFTLKPENARDPGAALASLLRFGAGATNSTLHESAGGEDVAVDLEAAVEEAFAAGSHEAAAEGDDLDSSFEAAGDQNTPAVEPSNTPSAETDTNQGGW